MSSKTDRKIHLTLLFLWVFPGIPVSFLLRESIAWLVFLAVYSIIVGHWSGWSSEKPNEEEQ